MTFKLLDEASHVHLLNSVNLINLLQQKAPCVCVCVSAGLTSMQTEGQEHRGSSIAVLPSAVQQNILQLTSYLFTCSSTLVLCLWKLISMKLEEGSEQSL